MKRSLRSISRPGALALLALGSPATLFATSGIRMVEDDAWLASEETPDPIEDRMTEFALTFRNTNDHDNEDVHASLILFQNIGLGSAELLGFRHFDMYAEYEGDYYYEGDTDFYFNLEDETTKTLYFAVATGESDEGCDFGGFEVTWVICDDGGDAIGDVADWGCESPTAFQKRLEWPMPEVASTSGTATIKGKVTADIKGSAKGIEASIHIKKTNACVVGALDNIKPYADTVIASSKSFQDPGTYSDTGLPAGTYTITAETGGVTFTKEVSVAEGGTYTVDFAF